MKFTHQTGLATLLQFILLSFLTLASQVVSVVQGCTGGDGGCIGNLLTSIIFYILVALVFGSIWLIGYGAESSRNKWLARLLFCTEGLIALVALFSFKLSLHSKNNFFGMLSSLAIAALALWITVMAWRLMKSEGQRISRGGRRRRRPVGQA